MLSFENIILFREVQNRREKKEKEIYMDSLEVLDFFQKEQLNKIERTIQKIIKEIEKRSNWEYNYPSFVMLSDFTYNPTNEQINYTVNEVYINTLEAKYDSKREKDFIEKYQKLLVKLQFLEQKKQEYINLAKEKIDYSHHYKVLNPQKLQTSKEYNNKYVKQQGKLFYERYQEEGIQHLITLINALANKDSLEDFYLILNNLKISDTYKKDLLKWVSIVSKRGVKLYESFREDPPVMNREEDSLKKYIVKRVQNEYNHYL